MRIVVADTGIGIPEDQIETVLTPFSQLAPGELAAEGGTGLGLSIASALVELHGGTLDIESTAGSGTTVTVHLPAVGPDTPREAA